MPIRLLVVDDHESVRKQLYWALEENYRVLEAASRAQALALLERVEGSPVPVSPQPQP